MVLDTTLDILGVNRCSVIAYYFHYGCDLQRCTDLDRTVVDTLGPLTQDGPYIHNVNMSKQIVPSKTEMRRYLAKGYTQQQIAEAWEADTGVRVSRAAIAMAISRYDLKSNYSRPRYEDTLPWTMRPEHQNDHNARMLRLEARRRRGQKLSEQETSWLASYTRTLKERDVVVTYVPDLPEGFVWVPRNKYDDDMIRKELRNEPPARKKRAASKAV